MCEACGLCCNGTLYNYVTTVPDDVPKLQKYPQLVLKVRNEQETFDEPCVLHDGRGCTAYVDRPATCSQYLCKLLRSVGRNERTEEEALLIIKEARALVENVQEYIAFEPGLPIAVSTWDVPPAGTDEEARLAWERTVYHLGKYFLGTVREEVELPKEPEVRVVVDASAYPEPPPPARPRVERAGLFAAGEKPDWREVASHHHPPPSRPGRPRP